MRDLYQIHYSPWSEKARWALEHHGLEYRRIDYQPMLGEPALRLRLRQVRGPVTVPVLFDGDRVFSDSMDIARHAEAEGEGAPLLAAEHLEEILRWNDTSQAALAVGRMQTTLRTAESMPAQVEVVKPLAPAGLEVAMRPLALTGIAYLKKKYGPMARDERPFEASLLALRSAIEASPSEYILGEFSYADIAMAVVMQFVDPVDDRHLRLGAATRPCWRNPELAQRYPDLLQWRDEIYDRHRRTESK